MPSPPHRFRDGSSEYAVVDARDVLEHLTESDALAMLHRMLAEDEWKARRQIRDLAVELDFGLVTDFARALSIVARAIAQGRLIPVRLRDHVRPLDEAGIVDLRDIGRDAPHDDPIVPLKPRTPTPSPGDEPGRSHVPSTGSIPKPPTAGDTTSIALRVCSEHGESYAGSRVRATFSDGTVQEGELDGGSTWRADSVAAGVCELELCGASSVAGDEPWGLRLPVRAERTIVTPDVQSASGDLAFDPARPRVLRLSTGREHHVVVKGPLAHRLVPGALVFRPRGVLTLPAPWRAFDPWDVVVALCGWLADRPDHGAVLVGHHTDDEDPRYARLRAEALLHMLHPNADAWVTIAEKDGRVGDTQGFLQYLAGRHGWPTALAVATDQADEATNTAVEAFQRTYNETFGRSIIEDGVIGVQTLRAVFEVAQWDLGRHLELGAASRDTLRWLDDEHPVLSCPRALAHHFPTHGGRALDVVLAPLAADIDVSAVPEAIDVYERPRRFDDVAIATVDIEDVGTLILDLDLLGHHDVAHEHMLHLRSTDGAIERHYQLTENEADIAHARFDGLDPSASYSLALSCVDTPGELVLFEDVPFAEIHTLPPTPLASPYPESGDVQHTNNDPDHEPSGADR